MQRKQKLGVDSPADAVWRDFIAANTDGQCLAIVSIQDNECRYEPAQARQIESKYLVFDCGHMIDPNHPHFIGNQEMLRLHMEASTLQQNGELKLPHPCCAFLFRYHRDRKNPSPDLNLNFLVECDEGLAGSVATKTLTRHSAMPHDRWIVAPIDYILPSHSDSMRGMVAAVLDEEARDVIGAFTQKQAQEARMLLTLVNRGGVLVESPSASVRVLKKVTIH